jgi:glycosidase
MAIQFPTVEWARHANIYEVNIRQYTSEGTFAAFAKHLPRLKEMGVEIVWLMPVTPISVEKRLGTLGSYYACSNYTLINPEFGSAGDFADLVNEVHALGMKLIIDWVANHTGWDHHWTTEHPEWYLQDDTGGFTEKHGWEDVIDLDYTVPEMRGAMIAAMQYWINEFHIDGFRCDMAHLVPLGFWREARTACDAIKPLYWLAECEMVNYHEVFDTTYAWHWMHVTGDHSKGTASLETVRNVLHGYSQYPAGATKLFFTSNHDENSWNGTEYEQYGAAAKPWAVFTQTWPGVSLIYSGQENPVKKRIRFFDKDQIDWQPQPALHHFYQALLHLRKHNPAMRDGEVFILPTNHTDQLMAFMRRKGDAVVLVLLNVSEKDKLHIHVQHNWLKGSFRNIFSGLHFMFGGDEHFELLKGEYLVYEHLPV